MPSPQTNFDALMLRIAEGSQTAVWELLEQYSEQIVRTVRRHLPTGFSAKLDARDIVQSAWKSLLLKDRALEGLGTAEQLVAYLAGVARMKCLETVRKYSSVQATDIRRERNYEEAAFGFADGAGRRNPHEDCREQSPSWIAGFRDDWNRKLTAAGDRAQQIVALRLRGLTYSEVAAEMGVSTATVRRTLQQMLEAIVQ